MARGKSKREFAKENADEALDYAKKQSDIFFKEAKKALKYKGLVSGEASKELFKEKAKAALSARKNWKKAVRLAEKVLQEIEEGKADG